jgi:RNA polymerase sigma-70 factor, ECF subfamily
MSKQNAIAAEIPRLRRYARALVGSEGEADDLVQETLARALEHVDQWRSGDNPRRWLFTILHNIYVDMLRSLSRRPAHSELDASIADPESPDGNSVLACEVTSALLKLSSEQREVVLLVGLEGLSYAETATVLGVPIGTVMSRLARGREKLRTLIGHEGSRGAGLRRVK